jgi:hypothetical protein
VINSATALGLQRIMRSFIHTSASPNSFAFFTTTFLQGRQRHHYIYRREPWEWKSLAFFTAAVLGQLGEQRAGRCGITWTHFREKRGDENQTRFLLHNQDVFLAAPAATTARILSPWAPDPPAAYCC